MGERPWVRVLRLKEPFLTRLLVALTMGLDKKNKVGEKHTPRFWGVICTRKTSKERSQTFSGITLSNLTTGQSLLITGAPHFRGQDQKVSLVRLLTWFTSE